jgi:WhiB family redox-sensing transcriptional regulator
VTLELLVAELRPAWQRRAACRGKPPAWWFTERGGMELELARRVCAGCAVRAECLEFALEAGDNLSGVWAGTSATERRRMLEARAPHVVEEELAHLAQVGPASSSSSTPAPVAAWLADATSDRWHIGRRWPTYAVRVLG